MDSKRNSYWVVPVHPILVKKVYTVRGHFFVFCLILVPTPTLFSCSSCCKQFLNIFSHFHWTNSGFISFDYISILVNQEFCKVPFDFIANRPFRIFFGKSSFLIIYWKYLIRQSLGRVLSFSNNKIAD